MGMNGHGTASQGYSRAFWTANFVELLERAAWYGVFIVSSLYLSRILGFNDKQAGVIAGALSAGLYFLPPFSGAVADRIGFRSALMLAFGLLTIGYGGMWLVPVLLENGGLVEYGIETTFYGLDKSWWKWSILPVLLVVMVGGSFIKSVITGTIARETSEATRAKGYSIFYAMVNIGAFSGKTIVKPMRVMMGDGGLFWLNLFAAGCTLLALVLVFFIYKSARSGPPEQKRSMAETWEGMKGLFCQGRLVALILIVTGFWMVQHQLYATMPKYVLRMAGEAESPSWYANVNPLVVVLTVSMVTHMMRRRSALFSMIIGMFIMPVAALSMAMGNQLGDTAILIFHPIAFMMVVGIAFQALAESFISPRFLEYFSLQAPKGEEGLYLGFSHLHSFISSIVAFGLSGFLLDRFCPDPAKTNEAMDPIFLSASQWAEASTDAHYIWYCYLGISVVAALALIIFGRVTARQDAQAAAAR